ncbi:MAG TPA: SRPBCC domain-containing protein [Candidatus Bathyarchaeia archaeon]|nr:SRPBCC domain-containing protein [Candidatus Bathyarchaeia archaeon]
MDKIIHQSEVLDYPLELSFRLFTESEHLANWLTNAAEIEPVVGGKYELFWNTANREIDSTIGCKVLAVEENKLLCFEWKGSQKFAALMNETRPFTHVTIFFMPHERGTEIHLLHNGWRDSVEWDEAREWFAMAWNMSFASLKKYIANQPIEKCCE